MRTSIALCVRRMGLRISVTASIVLTCAFSSPAANPKSVAGTNYFNSSMAGRPLTWPQGQIIYFTDQGDLSPALPNASANSFVADAFSQWTSAPTAALTATSAGQLAEDVSGSNVIRNSDGSIAMPADIQASATSTPVGVVYDDDGTVTDALLGSGAGSSSECFFNAVFGGDDNYGALATYQHALIVINGQCAQDPSQFTDVKYRLVRVIGSVIGVGWSQLNLNVQTGSPPPAAVDYAGFPVMHFTDAWGCVPITRCYSNPYQLSVDDIAAASRLYPVTTQNQSAFPGKQLFSATTARISGSVWFTDVDGNPTQAMQGVNVVARWIDPATGMASRQYAASSVSGFLFTGNAGNPITGFDDPLGISFSDWGSSDQSIEGFFDLSGLPLPTGGSAQYELTAEAVDPLWSTDVGSYTPGPVAPSGTATAVTVTVSAGSDIQQDILMANSAKPLPQVTSSWSEPAILPAGGDWISSLSDYGNLNYFSLTAQANRTLSIAVTPLDESGRPTEVKAQPVIGMWAASDPQGTPPPALTFSPFNAVPFALTRLDAQVFTSTNFLIGISDVRGDGRPDYHYHAHVLYGDTVAPARISVNGGAVTVLGTGFGLGLNSSIGTTITPQLEIAASQMILSAAPHPDGAQDITISDPTSGSSTTMFGALTYGAAATDNIVLLYGLNPPTPVGTQATNPMSVRVVAADGVTPVSGATISWSAPNGVQLSACSGASTCAVITDQSGDAASFLTPATSGVSTITATLAPGVYNPAKSVSGTLEAVESSSDIGVLTPYLWISQGATVSIPITARVLSNGSPQNNVPVNFTVVAGNGNLGPSTRTNSTGYATATLTVTNIQALVQVSACVSPGNAPCVVVYANPVPLSQQQLQQISGAGQVSSGAAFQPVVVRVTDLSSPPNSVIAAPVNFLTTVLRPIESESGNSGNPPMPVILKITANNLTSDFNGLASIVPSTGGFNAPVEVDVGVTAGTSAVLDDPLQVLAVPSITDAP
jgi:hypothetical protein